MDVGITVGVEGCGDENGVGMAVGELLGWDVHFTAVLVDIAINETVTTRSGNLCPHFGVTQVKLLDETGITIEEETT
jgi:hypothetical protein